MFCKNYLIIHLLNLSKRNLFDFSYCIFYFIKQISSEFEVICENIVTQKEYLENTYIEALDAESVGKYSKLRDAVCALLSTRDSVYKDGYVDNPSDFNIILPISAFKYKVRAVIKNDAIHKIFSDTIEMVLTGKTDAMGNFIIPNEINPDDTSAICAYRFHKYISNHVSKFIRNSKCELYDIMQREYLSIANMEGIVPDVKIAGIYGTECDIKFFNTTPEKLRENMKNSKKSGSAKITLCVHSTFKDMFSIACHNGVDIVALGDLNSFLKGGIDIGGNVPYLILGHLVLGLDGGLHPADGVEHRGVVPAELLSNVG